MFDSQTVLITGGTGSFGRKCTEILLRRHTPKKLIIFSRDELKQYEMAQDFPLSKHPCIRFFLGDIRDKERLNRAFSGVDYVIHAAALKQVPAAEYNPTEAIKTNVYGAQNIINAAADRGVKRVVALSSDKAVSPINLYGASKLCADKMFIAANAFISDSPTRFSIVRYGNVIGSRGSVIPFFLKKRACGVLPVTDPRMTRFWITLEHGVDFVLKAFERMDGGEIFVPKLPSVDLKTLSKAICPTCRIENVGIRPGEKLHESLITRDEARTTVDRGDHYVVLPAHAVGNGQHTIPPGFEYSSDTNPLALSVEQLRELLTELGYSL